MGASVPRSRAIDQAQVRVRFQDPPVDGPSKSEFENKFTAAVDLARQLVGIYVVRSSSEKRTSFHVSNDCDKASSSGCWLAIQGRADPTVKAKRQKPKRPANQPNMENPLDTASAGYVWRQVRRRMHQHDDDLPPHQRTYFTGSPPNRPENKPNLCRSAPGSSPETFAGWPCARGGKARLASNQRGLALLVGKQLLQGDPNGTVA